MSSTGRSFPVIRYIYCVLSLTHRVAMTGGTSELKTIYNNLKELQNQ